jgi:predicted aspartyl protease
MIAKVPFQLVGGAQPLAVVSARLNGSGPLAFALDTGAAQPVVVPEIARDLGIRVDETKAAMGAGGPIEVGFIRIDEFAVGAAVRRDVRAIVSAEVERVGAAIGSRLDGVIGYEFLRHFCVTIDYSRQLLALADAAAEGPRLPPKAHFPLRIAHASKPLLLVDAKVNGSGPHPFVLDTGASTCVLARQLTAQLGICSRRVAAMTGGGGTVAAAGGVLQSLAIEGAKVENLPVAIADFLEALSRVVEVDLAGIVGFNFLRHFVVTIDYPGSEVRLA